MTISKPSCFENEHDYQSFFIGNVLNFGNSRRSETAIALPSFGFLTSFRHVDYPRFGGTYYL